MVKVGLISLVDFASKSKVETTLVKTNACYESFRGRRSKAAGLALKVLEDNFPKQTGKMRDFYGWATDGNSEHDLLKTIVGLFRH